MHGNATWTVIINEVYTPPQNEYFNVQTLAVHGNWNV